MLWIELCPYSENLLATWAWVFILVAQTAWKATAKPETERNTQVGECQAETQSLGNLPNAPHKKADGIRQWTGARVHCRQYLWVTVRACQLYRTLSESDWNLLPNNDDLRLLLRLMNQRDWRRWRRSKILKASMTLSSHFPAVQQSLWSKILLFNLSMRANGLENTTPVTFNLRHPQGTRSRLALSFRCLTLLYMFHILLARPRIALAVGWRRLKDRWRGGRTELARGSFRLLIRCHFEIAMCSGQW